MSEAQPWMLFGKLKKAHRVLPGLWLPACGWKLNRGSVTLFEMPQEYEHKCSKCMALTSRREFYNDCRNGLASRWEGTAQLRPGGLRLPVHVIDCKPALKNHHSEPSNMMLLVETEDEARRAWIKFENLRKPKRRL
jgi:hypothetical protein